VGAILGVFAPQGRHVANVGCGTSKTVNFRKPGNITALLGESLADSYELLRAVPWAIDVLNLMRFAHGVPKLQGFDFGLRFPRNFHRH